MSSIPTYHVQTAFTLVSICISIDKIIRNFIWGGSQDIKRPHLLSWDKVCCPKKYGGLSLRKARDINVAMLMKIGWGIINNKDSLWMQILWSKYSCGDNILPVMKKENNSSNLWLGGLA